jgi:DNA-binding LacI/PurR family transcriptional regulator
MERGRCARPEACGNRRARPDARVRCTSGGAVDGRADSIDIDNYGGAYAMVRHLVGTTRRRVAVITGTPNNRDAAERLRGYRDALPELGIEHRAEWELAGNFTEASGYEAAGDTGRRLQLGLTVGH